MRGEALESTDFIDTRAVETQEEAGKRVSSYNNSKTVNLLVFHGTYAWG